MVSLEQLAKKVRVGQTFSYQGATYIRVDPKGNGGKSYKCVFGFAHMGKSPMMERAKKTWRI